MIPNTEEMIRQMKEDGDLRRLALVSKVLRMKQAVGHVLTKALRRKIQE